MGSKTYGLEVGMVITSNNTGAYEVVNFEPKSCVKLKSLACGNEVIVRTTNATQGSIGNKLYPTFFGKGYIGYGIYKTRDGTKEPKNKYYSTWENMLARCYYSKTSRFSAYGGQGVTVCEEWLNLQNFAKWFEDNYKEGWHLDKDILGDGMQYNPDVCRFVPQEINGLFVNNTKFVGKMYDLPVGVSYSKYEDLYQCTLNEDERFKSASLREVMEYYQINKTLLVRNTIEKYKNLVCRDIYKKLSTYEFKYEGEDNEI